MIPIEIERKFLIRMPSIALLTSQKQCSVKQITQTYLTSEDGHTRRVRKTVTNGTVSYRATEKRRLTDLSAMEEEGEITENAYLALLSEADPNRTPIEKTRYTFPFEGHQMEIDVYPFWQDRAILEIELASEGEAYAIPPFLQVIKEVSDDRRYKNAQLAKEIVYEP